MNKKINFHVTYNLNFQFTKKKLTTLKLNYMSCENCFKVNEKNNNIFEENVK